MRRSRRSKISPAFEPFLREAPRDAIWKAIVIYSRPPTREIVQAGERLQRTAKVELIKEIVAAQRPVEEKLRDTYYKTGRRVIGRTRVSEQSFQSHAALGMATIYANRRMLHELAAQNDVEAILPNQRIHAIQPFFVDDRQLRQTERKQKQTWGLTYLQVEELWKVTKGKGVTVAVLDTGVHSDHPDLQDKVWKFMLFDPLARQIEANPAFDSGQHGTHVCGTIAGGNANGIAIGVAPEANLIVGAVLVGEPTLSTLLRGIQWAVEEGADIINMSLGFTYYEPNFAVPMRRLLNDGVLPVVAVGNETLGNIRSPGNDPSALSVGALEKMPNSGYGVAEFSSGGTLVFPRQNPAQIHKPDVVAPGVQVWSAIPPQTGPGDTIRLYAYFDGTSMAAPHVSGVAALLMAANPRATAREIMSTLCETAQHPSGDRARPDNRWGWGAIRPLAALEALRR